MIVVPIVVVAIIITVVIVVMIAACAVDQFQILLIEIEGGGLLGSSCGLVAKYAEKIFHDVFLLFLLLCDYFFMIFRFLFVLREKFLFALDGHSIAWIAAS